MDNNRVGACAITLITQGNDELCNLETVRNCLLLTSNTDVYQGVYTEIAVKQS